MTGLTSTRLLLAYGELSSVVHVSNCRLDTGPTGATMVICLGSFNMLSSFCIIQTSIPAGQSAVQFLTGARNVSLLQNIQHDSEIHTPSYPLVTRGSFPPGGVKQESCKVNHLSLSNVEVRRFDRSEVLTAMLLRTRGFLDCLNLEMKAPQSFEMPTTTHPVTQHHSP
jgi:hypothetical protein